MEKGMSAPAALQEKDFHSFLEENLDWIRERVRRRLGPRLRRKEETGDIVQEAVLQFLDYGPKVAFADRKAFRSLLARIAENVLRDRNDWYAAQRRAISRERPLPSDTVLFLDPPRKGPATSCREADKKEREGWIRLGIELLGPEDRELIVLRDWKGRTFPEIGARLEIQEDTARMRYRASFSRLADVVGALRRGELDQILGEKDPA